MCPKEEPLKWSSPRTSFTLNPTSKPNLRYGKGKTRPYTHPLVPETFRGRRDLRSRDIREPSPRRPSLCRNPLNRDWTIVNSIKEFNRVTVPKYVLLGKTKPLSSVTITTHRCVPGSTTQGGSGLANNPDLFYSMSFGWRTTTLPVSPFLLRTGTLHIHSPQHFQYVQGPSLKPFMSFHISFSYDCR